MNPKIKKLLEKRATLMADIEAAETIEELQKANEGINAIDAEIDLIKQKSAMLDALGTKTGEPEVIANSDASGMTIGQHFVKSVNVEDMDTRRNFTVYGPEFGEKSAAPMGVPSGMTFPLQDVVEGPRFNISIGDLFTNVPVTEGNSVTWLVEDASVEGGFAVVAELGSKPMVSWTYTEKSATLKKIAGHYKESDELLEDAPRLAAAIDSRGTYLHALAEAGQYLNGDGTGNNMTGLLNTSGIQTQNYTHGGSMDFDTILAALGKVSTASCLMADNIVLNPADYYAMLALKDENKQYLAGGPVFGPYGQAAMPVLQRVHLPFWNVPTYVTPVISSGSAVVGAFKMGGEIHRKGGVRVGIFNQNEDDAIKNAITVVVESRSLLAVKRPNAFVKITEAAS